MENALSLYFTSLKDSDVGLWLIICVRLLSRFFFVMIVLIAGYLLGTLCICDCYYSLSGHQATLG
jgi:hypothetical protein